MGDPGTTSKESQLSTDASAQLHTDLWQYGRRRAQDGPYADNLDIDALVIGAGFAGTYSLYSLRKAGLRTVVYEAGQGFGGTWRWNCYPGARVDSPVPIYELSIPEVYNSWHWTTNYPDWHELRAYFDHVDKVLDLSKDCAFETVVVGAEFDTNDGKWTVKTQDGRTAKARFLIAGTGFAARRYVPNFKGLEEFKGIVHHSSFWPENVDFQDKNVAVIGTGASGVQMIQEIGPAAKHLTVFQRCPNLALPMGRRDISEEEQDQLKPFYKEIMDYRERCFAGFHYDLCERNTFDDTPEERRAHFDKLWKQAGFALWLGGYKDYLFDEKSNREAYNYWREKQSARVKNPEKKKALFPEEPPHPFGVKRPCLEQNYYEVLDQDNVDIVDINMKNGTPIKEFTEHGIITSDGKEYGPYDIVGLATGFDVVTGGLTNMGLKSIHGKLLKDEWKDGAYTYLGTTISGYPNFFHIYGPQAPTLLSNGPSTVEIQVRWIVDAIKLIIRHDIKYINPAPEAQAAYKERVNAIMNATLFPKTTSTYMGGTMPGKKQEAMCYGAGVDKFGPEIRATLTDWKGFEVVAAH